MGKKRPPRRPAPAEGSFEEVKLERASEELRAWAAVLGDEVATWPSVHSRPMFGLVSFYRDDKIFAALPRTRVLTGPHSIILRFHAKVARSRKARKELQEYPAKGWASFELRSPEDVSAALHWLDVAYRSAR